jgi:hypothetical protein
MRRVTMDKLTHEARMTELKFQLLYAVMQLTGVNLLLSIATYVIGSPTVKGTFFVLQLCLNGLFLVGAWYQYRKGKTLHPEATA